MPRAVCFHCVCACGSLRVSALAGTHLLLSQGSCCPHGAVLGFLWAGAFYPGDSHQVFIIPWMILEADSILNSSLSLWLWLALGSRKIQGKMNFICYCASSYTDQGPTHPLGPEEGRGRGTGFLCSLQPWASAPFSGPTWLTQDPPTSGAQHPSWYKSSAEIPFLEWQWGHSRGNAVRWMARTMASSLFPEPD